MEQRTLRLRPPRPSDEDVVLAAQREMADDGFLFALHLEEGDDFEEWCDRVAAYARGDVGDTGLVPGDFLLAEVDGMIVGRASIRHELNEFLLRDGGHVGYGVRPAFRRRGHATDILCQSLGRLRSLGIERVLVTCDDDNVASIAVIGRAGGELDGRVELDDGRVVRRYWIDQASTGFNAPESTS